MQVLQSATLNAARYLGITDAFGTVELGKTADLVLLEGNPLEDIRNTRKISAVVVNGKIIVKDFLQLRFAEDLPVHHDGRNLPSISDVLKRRALKQDKVGGPAL